MKTMTKNLVGRLIFSAVLELLYCLVLVWMSATDEQLSQSISENKLFVFAFGVSVFFSGYYIATFFLIVNSKVKNVLLSLILTPPVVSVFGLVFLAIGWILSYLLRENEKLSVIIAYTFVGVPLILIPIISVVRWIVWKVHDRES